MRALNFDKLKLHHLVASPVKLVNGDSAAMTLTAHSMSDMGPCFATHSASGPRPCYKVVVFRGSKRVKVLLSYKPTSWLGDWISGQVEATGYDRDIRFIDCTFDIGYKL